MALSSAPAEDDKRLVIVAPSVAGLLRHRAPVLQDANRRGIPVLVIAPTHLAGEIAALHALGAEHRNIDLNPPGFSMLARHRLTSALRDLIAAWSPSAVLVSDRGLASIAATAARRACNARIVTLVNDLGSGSEEERRRRASAYRRAVNLSGAVLTHNAADTATVIGALAVPPEKVQLIRGGAGIDVRAVPPEPMPPFADGMTFAMIADPAESTAITVYSAAARQIASRGTKARFLLATDREAAGDPTILTVAGVEFVGKAPDARSVLANAHVAVHLCNDDGAPAALRDALALGRPILTIDAPGCRDMVDDRVNGCRITPDDAGAVEAGLASFCDNPGLLASEARASRAKAERLFDAAAAPAAYLSALGL